MTLRLNSSPLLFCYLLYDGESAAETLHESFASANLKDLKVFLPPPPLTPPRTVSVALVCQHFTTTSRATRKWDRQALSLTTQLIPVDKLTLCDNIIMSPWQQSFLWWTLNELSYPRLFFSLIGKPKQCSNLRWKFYDKGKVCCLKIWFPWCGVFFFFLMSFIDLNENYHFAEQEWADMNKKRIVLRAETEFLVWEWK